MEVRIRLSEMSSIREPPMKAVLKSSTQLTSKSELRAQPEPMLMPKGKGTVRLPHLLGQPRLATTPDLEMLYVSAAAAAAENVEVRLVKRKHTRRGTITNNMNRSRISGKDYC